LAKYKFIIIGAVLCGWATFFISYDDHLRWLWLLSWPLGAAAGYIAWVGFHPTNRAARRAMQRVDEFRADAAELRETNPRIYTAMLDSPRGRRAVKAGDPQKYVAFCLAAAADEVGVEPVREYARAAPL
jgi:hypothetical protein